MNGRRVATRESLEVAGKISRMNLGLCTCFHSLESVLFPALLRIFILARMPHWMLLNPEDSAFTDQIRHTIHLLRKKVTSIFFMKEVPVFVFLAAASVLNKNIVPLVSGSWCWNDRRFGCWCWRNTRAGKY
jgi:hypothetical protein